MKRAADFKILTRDAWIFVGSQVALALVSSALAFVLVNGLSAELAIGTTLMLAAVFAAALLSIGASRIPEYLTLESQSIARLLLAALAGGAGAMVLRFMLPLQFNAAEIGLTVSLVVFFGLTIPLTVSKLEGLKRERRPGMQRTIIVGSGAAAASLVRLIRENGNFRYSVVGCVDDEILGREVGGKRVIGCIDDLPRLVNEHRVACVIIAIPAATPQLVKRVMAHCSRDQLEARSPAVKILPGVLELLNDGARLGRIRPVQPEDLLPRDPVSVDLSEIVPHVENRVILVTGAGGSIGSELCRQIVSLNPSLLLLLGHGENSLFAINQELKLRFGFNRTKIILADVADASRIRNVFSTYRPHVVFHAAAHKHVPIVEANICESARNNVLGTHVVALAAAAAGSAKFVLLSTDKAVNPTSVMGATKRLSEIISQSFANQTGTEFVTVRFGNVLESRGSVIPVFKKQIEGGGPLTITHRDMQRYFMTIPEAVSLVLQGMAIGRDGQVLVLDMGKPVNILRLAETLITLSGLTPYRDIDIIETGIRPGEKLFEEILTTSEGMSTTSHARLFIAQQERVAYETLALGLRTLETAIRAGDSGVVVDVLLNFIPSYRPGPHIFGVTASEQVVDGSSGSVMSSANGHAVVEVDQLDDSPREQPAFTGTLGSAQPAGVLTS